MTVPVSPGASAPAPLSHQDAQRALEQMAVHFHRAAALYKERNYDQAAAELQAAHEARPLPILLEDAALCHEMTPGRRPAALPGFLVIEGAPGLTIHLDDIASEPLGTTPWSGRVEGRHRVILTDHGHPEQEMDINVEPGRVSTIYLAR